MQSTPKAFALTFTALALLLLAILGRASALTGAVGAAILALIAYMASVAKASEEALYYVHVERRPEQARVAEGEPVELRILVTNPTGRPLYNLIVRDDVPPRARPEHLLVHSGSLEPRSRVEAVYTVRPAPGLTRVTRVELEAGDPLGLFRVRREFHVNTTLQVYPRPYPVEVSARERLGLAEALRARGRGWGYEFYSLRDYVPGDDVRLVAWLPTGRAGKLVVRENVEEKVVDVCVFLDLSLESWAGPPGDSAADWIMRVSLGLMEAVARVGGLAGYLVFAGEAMLRAPPTRAPEASMWLAEQLTATSPLHVTSRRRMSRAIRDLEDSAPRSCVTVYLIGPGGVGDVLEALEEKPTRFRALVVEVLPMGSDRLSEALRRGYRRLDGPHLERLRRMGVPSCIAESPAALALSLIHCLEEAVKHALPHR